MRLRHEQKQNAHHGACNMCVVSMSLTILPLCCPIAVDMLHGVICNVCEQKLETFDWIAHRHFHPCMTKFLDTYCGPCDMVFHSQVPYEAREKLLKHIRGRRHYFSLRRWRRFRSRLGRSGRRWIRWPLSARRGLSDIGQLASEAK